jgi:tetratricopeptide (TPR) repeat protein
MKKNNLYIAGLLLFVAALFLNTLGNQFVNYDDDQFLLNNSLIREFSFKSIYDIFVTYWDFSTVYRPLVYTTYAIEYQLWGLSPTGYHLASLLLHLLNVFLCFKVTQKLSGTSSLALVVALLFAIHPMRTESVAWALAQADVLYASFFLFGLLTYLKSFENPNTLPISAKGLHAITFIAFLGAVFSKPTAIVFPAVLTLIDLYKNKDLNSLSSNSMQSIIRSTVGKLHFWVVSAGMAMITVMVQSKFPEITFNQYNFLEKIVVIFYSISFYILKFFVPIGNNPHVLFPAQLDFQYYLVALLFPAVVLVLWLLKAHRNTTLFGFLFFLLNIILVANIVGFGRTIVADRYTYLPHIGLLWAILLPIWEKNKQSMALWGFVALYAIWCSFSTFRQNTVWYNSYTLWNTVITHQPTNHLAYFSRANMFRMETKLPEALLDYDRAISLQSQDHTYYTNRALTKTALQDFAGAKTDFDKALSINPYNSDVYKNRALFFYFTNNFAAAEQDLTKALTLKTNDPEIFHYRGIMLFQLGKQEQACEDWRKAAQMNFQESIDMMVGRCP